MNGIQPTPLSTETNFCVGKRSSRPLKIRFEIVRQLFRKKVQESVAR